MFRQGATREIKDPALLVPDLLPELKGFIMKACQHQKTERYQSVREAMETLHPAISQGSKIDPDNNNSRKLTSIILQYDQKQQAALNRLLSEFSLKANDIGIDLKLLGLNE